MEGPTCTMLASRPRPGFRFVWFRVARLSRCWPRNNWKEIMGHSSVVVTERYAHLKPELFRAAEYELLNVDLAGEGPVV